VPSENSAEDAQGFGQQPPVYYVFFLLWIVSAVVSTCYTFTWDIKMDWGLFDGPHKLRKELIYPTKVRPRSSRVSCTACSIYARFPIFP